MAEQHDATLLVQLAQWGSSLGLEEAQQHLWSDEFDPETADPRDPLVGRALTFFETVGTLTKNGLLDRALVLDWVWVAGIWARVAPAVNRARQDLGVPELYENFELLASQQG
jgi:hypothetical protein